jgi:hypothetical protein
MAFKVKYILYNFGYGQEIHFLFGLPNINVLQNIISSPFKTSILLLASCTHKVEWVSLSVLSFLFFNFVTQLKLPSFVKGFSQKKNLNKEFTTEYLCFLKA